MGVLLPLVIVVLTVVMGFIFSRIESFRSRKAIMVIFLYVLVLVLKIKSLGPPTSDSLLGNDLYQSILITAALLLIGFGALSFLEKQPTQKPQWYFLKIFIAYIPFGILQQLLFQYVVFESLLKIFHFSLLAISVSAAVFFIFHLRIVSPSDKLLIPGMGFIFSAVYYNFGGILWLSLVHALCAAVFFTIFISRDMIKERLGSQG